MQLEDSITQILESTTQAGPKMTSALANYGNGRMGDGILKLMAWSERTGIMKGALIAGAAASVVVFASNLYMWRKIEQIEQNDKCILKTLLNDMDRQQPQSPNSLPNVAEKDRITFGDEFCGAANEGQEEDKEIGT